MTTPSSSNENDVDLRDLFRSLWAGKWVIGAITFAAAVIAVIVALMLPDIYRTEALLAPNLNDGVGGLSSQAAQYGDLASMAGITIDSGAPDKKALALEVLNSRRFLSEFIERHDILVPLMAATDWDRESGELEIDADVFDISSSEWVRKAQAPRKSVPSLQEAYEIFREENLSIAQDMKTGFVTITVEHYSPTVAKQWVDWLVQDINATVMRQDVDEAEQAIEYLEEQITATSLAGLQNIFFKLIEEQTKTVMLAKVSPEYMFRTIDPAIAPELKSRPKRAVISILGMVLGGMIGTIFVLATSKSSRRSN